MHEGRDTECGDLAQATLLEERDLGVLLSLVTLLLGTVSRSYEGYESLIPRIVKLLVRLNPERERDSAGRAVPPDRASVPPEYAYYGIPSPWLQVCATTCPMYAHMMIDSDWYAAFPAYLRCVLHCRITFALWLICYGGVMRAS